MVVVTRPCCADHGRACEPPSELCCYSCPEAGHPQHLDGSECAAPDLSGNTLETAELLRSPGTGSPR